MSYPVGCCETPGAEEAAIVRIVIVTVTARGREKLPHRWKEAEN